MVLLIPAQTDQRSPPPSTTPAPHIKPLLLCALSLFKFRKSELRGVLGHDQTAAAESRVARSRSYEGPACCAVEWRIAHWYSRRPYPAP